MPTFIKRYGKISDRTVGLVDDLSMTYGGNRVLAVSDAAASVILESSLDFDAGNDDALYGYDADGRLILDTGRGITTISYAPNDRPVYTKMDDATFDCLYSADGCKLKSKAVTGFRKLKGLESFADEPGDAPDGKGDLIIDPVIPVLPSVSQPTEERYYIGPFELTKYYNDKMVGALMKPGLSRVNMSWGYVDSEGNNCEYVPDYQGNIRVVMKGNQVIQQTDYYPYGLPIATSAGAAVNRYKYSGKEFDTRGGLNSYDFHARRYAPALPIFDCPDPKSWDYPDTNPYLYCAANPIMIVDPTGEDVWKLNEAGEIVEHIETDEYDKFVIVGSDNEVKTIQNENGENIPLEITFEYGTVTQVEDKFLFSYPTGTDIYTCFTINGNENATSLYEFLTQPGITTNVEWSRTGIGLEENQKNKVGTSHNKEGTCQGARLLIEHYTIWYDVHNHPRNSNPAPDDVYIANKIRKKFPNANIELRRNNKYEPIPK